MKKDSIRNIIIVSASITEAWVLGYQKQGLENFTKYKGLYQVLQSKWFL